MIELRQVDTSSVPVKTYMGFGAAKSEAHRSFEIENRWFIKWPHG
jgi:hypothetical protein